MGHMSQRDQRVLVLAFQDYSIGTLAHHSKNVVFVHATPEMSPLTFVRLGGGQTCTYRGLSEASADIGSTRNSVSLDGFGPQKQARIIVK